MVKISKINF